MTVKMRLTALFAATVMMLALAPAGMQTALADDGDNTCRISFAVGEGHDTAAAQILESMQQDPTIENASLNGTTIELDVANSQTVGQTIEQLEGFANYWKYSIDDDSTYDRCTGAVGMRPMQNYENAQEYAEETAAVGTNSVESDQTYYMFWEKPMSDIALTVEQPFDGTEVTVTPAGEGSTAVQTPSPQVNVVGEVHLATENSGGNDGYWLAELPAGFNLTPEPFSGTMHANTDYYVVSYLCANYGYYFDQGLAEKITFNGRRFTKIDSLVDAAVETVLVYGTIMPTESPSELITITEQPEDVSVAYPNGAQFHVAVDHQDLVASYKWKVTCESELQDGSFEYIDYDLDGTSASTDTLIIPSTEFDTHRWFIECTITDIDGNTVVSRQAVRTITNPHAKLPVLYVCEYAIQPGESLNLADKGLGTGTVTFNADAHTLTFNDFKLNNKDTSVFDSSICPTQGVFLCCPKDQSDAADEYHMVFNGNSVLDNEYFDASINSGGVTLNGFFGTSDYPNKPTLLIEGDSPLTIKGGQFGIRIDGELELCTDVNIEALGTNYCDAIRANSIYINPGIKVDLDCCGAGLIAFGGDMFIMDGAEVTIDSLMPRISKGTVVKSLIYAAGNINCKGAKITINGDTSPEKTKVTNLTGIEFGGSLKCDNTNIAIALSSQRSGSLYAANFNGITSGGLSSSLEMTNGSSISIDYDVPEVFGGVGVMLDRNLDMEEGCTLDVNVAAQGRVIGLSADNEVLLQDAAVNVSAKSYSEDGDKLVIGTMCNRLSFTGSTCEQGLCSKAEGGTALIAGVGAGTGLSGYDPDYTPANIQIGETAAVLVPTDGLISSYGYVNPFQAGQFLAGETVYDQADTSAPAQEVQIGVPHTFGTSNVQVKKATPTQDGYTYQVCQICGRDGAREPISKASNIKLEKKKYTFTGKAIKPGVVVKTAAGETLGTDCYTVTYSNNKNAGTATAHVTFKGARYTGSKDLTFQIAKAKNTLKATGGKVTVAKSSLTKTIKRSKAIKLSKAKGTVSYVKKSGNKKISINKKTGKIKIKKGLKKGTYKLKVKVKAAGNANYKALTDTVTVKIVIK